MISGMCEITTCTTLRRFWAQNVSQIVTQNVSAFLGVVLILVVLVNDLSKLTEATSHTSSQKISGRWTAAMLMAVTYGAWLHADYQEQLGLRLSRLLTIQWTLLHQTPVKRLSFQLRFQPMTYNGWHLAPYLSSGTFYMEPCDFFKWWYKVDIHINRSCNCFRELVETNTWWLFSLQISIDRGPFEWLIFPKSTPRLAERDWPSSPVFTVILQATPLLC